MTVCHGKDGKGGGTMAKSLKVAPPDLARIAMRNGGRFPMARIQRIISGEEPLPAGHGTREMPVWGPIFSQVAWDQDLGRVRVDNRARANDPAPPRPCVPRTVTVNSAVAACAGDRGRAAHHSSSENFLVLGGGR